MKDLYDITEGILDDEDIIMNTADKAASLTVSAEWLRAHGCNYRLEHIVRDPERYEKQYSNGVWHMPDVELIIGKKEEVPDFVKVDMLKSLVLSAYDGDTLPDLGLKEVGTISYRNCPKLKSLVGTPLKCKTFAVSGCPKITSLDGCPKEVEKMFKFINNGISVTPKDVMRACKVSKNNIIFDKK